MRRQAHDGQPELFDLAHGLEEARQIDRLAHVAIRVEVVALDDVALGSRKLMRCVEHLGATSIAEGIENQAQLAAMTGFGVRLGQGYLWGKPEGS